MQSERMLAEFYFTQEQAKARHHEAEPHHGQPGTNPRQKRALRGQVDARVFGRHRASRDGLRFARTHARPTLGQEGQPARPAAVRRPDRSTDSPANYARTRYFRRESGAAP